MASEDGGPDIASHMGELLIGGELRTGHGLNRGERRLRDDPAGQPGGSRSVEAIFLVRPITGPNSRHYPFSYAPGSDRASSARMRC